MCNAVIRNDGVNIYVSTGKYGRDVILVETRHCTYYHFTFGKQKKIWKYIQQNVDHINVKIEILKK